VVNKESDIFLSSIDKDRFGFQVARSYIVQPSDVEQSIEYCKTQKVCLLIARCSTSNLDSVQVMEQNEFHLMDTLVYYSRDLDNKPIPEDYSSIPVRPVKPGEEEDVKVVASRAFRGYYGHYHADPRLDKTKCDETYIDWAYQSCISKEVAEEVLVADRDGEIIGFATLRFNDTEEGEGVLFGIDPSAQGQGIYRSFIINGMRYFQNCGRSRMIVSTQVTNIAVQKVWVRTGFEICSSYYTMHRWFD
jgi:ribosomal protein S18 acetylase RimI-like enzyme